MGTNFKGRTLDENKKAEVYFNLHDHVFSARQNGLVKLHSDVIILEEVSFRVSEVLRQKVIASGSKNVHARVYGWITSTDRDDVDLDGYRRAHYNPYETETFIDRETEEPIIECDSMILIDKRMYWK